MSSSLYFLSGFILYRCYVPVAQWLEHCVSSAKVVGSIPREHMYWQKKSITWMHCKSFWIKASAKYLISKGKVKRSVFFASARTAEAQRSFPLVFMRVCGVSVRSSHKHNHLTRIQGRHSVNPDSHTSVCLDSQLLKSMFSEEHVRLTQWRKQKLICMFVDVNVSWQANRKKRGKWLLLTV